MDEGELLKCLELDPTMPCSDSLAKNPWKIIKQEDEELKLVMLVLAAFVKERD